MMPTAHTKANETNMGDAPPLCAPLRCYRTILNHLACTGEERWPGRASGYERAALSCLAAA